MDQVEPQHDGSLADNPTKSVWRERYAEKHRLKRIHDAPAGIRLPQRVRIYERASYFLLQWWDKQEKRTLSERVEGDLVSAIFRARQIDERLEHFRSSGRKAGKCDHATVVEKFLANLTQRADAGEIDVATVRRYQSALQRHYLAFVEQPSVGRRYRHVGAVDREFRLEFSAFLNHVQVSPNGHPNAKPQPLKKPAFILDVVRAMLEWAEDAERGALLPSGFRNPFVRRSRESRQVATNLLRPPEITLPMAAALIQSCDQFQLAIFAPLVLFGLRPGELGWIFREQVKPDWLDVPCNLDLDYFTKGRREKGFPLHDCLRSLWGEPKRTGLLFVHRRAEAGKTSLPLAGSSLAELVEEFRRRCGAAGQISAEKRRRIRNALMKDAGQLKYDYIEAEFQQLSQALGWPANATLKDLRHLFSTCLENAGMPQFYRRYLMGQSFGRAPIVAYTHITEDQVRKHYAAALSTELLPLLEAIQGRMHELGIGENEPPEILR